MRVPSAQEMQLLRDENEIWSDTECVVADEMVRLGWLTVKALPEDDDYECEYDKTRDGELALKLATMVVS